MTEFEKLKNAAELIETMTDGGVRFRESGLGIPYLSADEKTAFGVTMELTPDFETEQYGVKFTAYLREMYRDMGAADVSRLESEAWKTHTLLTALESRTYSPSQAEFSRFRDWVTERENQAMEQNDVPKMTM
jgi:hypothetical protein